jgi:hypothetical protein
MSLILLYLIRHFVYLDQNPLMEFIPIIIEVMFNLKLLFFYTQTGSIASLDVRRVVLYILTAIPVRGIHFNGYDCSL